MGQMRFEADGKQSLAEEPRLILQARHRKTYDGENRILAIETELPLWIY